MNQMPGFRGAAPRLRQQAFGSGTRSQLLEAKRSPVELEAAVRPDDSRRGYAAYWGMMRPHGQRRNSRPPSGRKQGRPNVRLYHRQAVRHWQASGASLALRYSNRRSRCGLGPGSFQAPQKLLTRLPCPANAMPSRGSCPLQPGASITARGPASADNLQSFGFPFRDNGGRNGRELLELHHASISMYTRKKRMC
jgi:hypothetical protein